ILSDLASNNAPAFEFALAGDISKNNIWELFFKSGNFIENSGLNVDKIKDCIHEYKLDEPDRLFLQALVIYWPYFC
ncbi:MAG TPA: hypothetical protein VJW95_02245, partial [Dissulfurispiraceae bacterium]|nr:hypothetical protein [Dissulfurispiraceae bacterium]